MPATSRHRARLVTLPLCLLLTGFAPVTDGSSPPPATGPYTGPWAATFDAWSAMTDVRLGLDAFADSRITAEERAAGMELIEECYAAHGYAVSYDRFGFETATSTGGTEDSSAVMGECAFADGGVVALSSMIAVNPQNEDMLRLTADCLVAEGLVPAGYTREDVESAPTIPGASVPGSAGERCLRDPSGLLAPS